MAILWRGRDANRLDWLTKAALSVVFMLYTFLIGRWDWLGYYLGYIWWLAFAAALVVSYRRVRDAPLAPGVPIVINGRALQRNSLLGR
ncbi:MAG TPA: hypothetical protein VK879_17005 [Candidatus Sulfomarinibacteraceae bacterium]|nr:hypothetical protein [Candidatus Sulfomarinibacteraceae bacterium]